MENVYGPSTEPVIDAEWEPGVETVRKKEEMEWEIFENWKFGRKLCLFAEDLYLFQ